MENQPELGAAIKMLNTIYKVELKIYANVIYFR